MKQMLAAAFFAFAAAVPAAAQEADDPELIFKKTTYRFEDGKKFATHAAFASAPEAESKD